MWMLRAAVERQIWCAEAVKSNCSLYKSYDIVGCQQWLAGHPELVLGNMKCIYCRASLSLTGMRSVFSIWAMYWYCWMFAYLPAVMLLWFWKGAPTQEGKDNLLHAFEHTVPEASRRGLVAAQVKFTKNIYPHVSHSPRSTCPTAL